MRGARVAYGVVGSLRNEVSQGSLGSEESLRSPQRLGSGELGIKGSLVSLGREGREGKGSLGSKESLRCLMSEEGLGAW